MIGKTSIFIPYNIFLTIDMNISRITLENYNLLQKPYHYFAIHSKPNPSQISLKLCVLLSPPPLNLENVISYSKNKEVSVILHMTFYTLLMILKE